MRTLLTLLLLILVLFGFIQLRGQAANLHYVTSGAPGEVLYAAAFDGFQDEWELYNERRVAEFADGVLRLSNSEANNGSYSVAKARFADFDLTLDGRAVAGSENNGYGVIFRLQDRRNYYLFEVSSDGYYRVARVVNEDVRELSTWIESPLVNTGIGAMNRLRVVARGDQFEFYINGERAQVCIPNNPEAQSTFLMDTCIDGQMLDTLTDATIAQGQVGAVIETFDTSGVTVEFDNLVVLGS
ncbi:MAG: DUF1080 domain-containing protein [Chloroflexi bacterium]|nr:DUF1080 domain-containing protein [Chloroflexota bacterium]